MVTVTQSYLSPAKINLTLSVTGRNQDGYHMLDSLVVFSTIGDTITLTPTDDDKISLSIDGTYGDKLPTNHDNLMMQAVQKIKSYAFDTGQSCGGVKMTLTKNIPISSGIGGGSSNCATVLRELPLLWGVAIPDGDMADIALSLGADVPICVVSQSSRMQGTGNQISPIDTGHNPISIVLVNGGIPVDTKAVFEHFQHMRGQGDIQYTPIPDNPMDDAWDISPLDMIKTTQNGHNDLQKPAVQICPVIGDVLKILSAFEPFACIGMSGSGGTCFALFEGDDGADKAGAVADAIATQYPKWWVASGEII